MYSPRGFAEAGLDVRGLANSALVEYCNNANNWAVVMTLVDAQATLANDSWSAPGSWIDADMLTVGCNDNPIPHTPCAHGTPLTLTEEYTQFSLWCIFASNLLLGSDLRNISSTTLEIISNAEALEVNRDPLGAHGRLVHEAGSEPINMTCAAGGTAKFDMHVANMTIEGAREWCIGTARCAGFASEVPFAPSLCAGEVDKVLQVHFMDAWALARTGSNASWTHWHAPPPSPPLLQIFAKPMTAAVAANGEPAAAWRGGARRRAVAVFNRGSTTVSATVEWSMIGIDAPWSRSSHVRDLWAHADLGVFDGGYTVASLEPHATALLMVTEAPDHSMHEVASPSAHGGVRG